MIGLSVLVGAELGCLVAGWLSLFGDARLVTKVRAPMPERLKDFGTALVVPVCLPVGVQQSFNSDGSFRAEPRLVLDRRHSRFALAANAGS